MRAIGFLADVEVHVVIYMTCQDCARVGAAVFAQPPSEEETLAARPTQIADCHLNRWITQATTVRRRRA